MTCSTSMRMYQSTHKAPKRGPLSQLQTTLPTILRVIAQGQRGYGSRRHAKSVPQHENRTGKKKKIIEVLQWKSPCDNAGAVGETIPETTMELTLLRRSASLTGH